jgi:hypothetical protein
VAPRASPSTFLLTASSTTRRCLRAPASSAQGSDQRLGDLADEVLTRPGILLANVSTGGQHAVNRPHGTRRESGRAAPAQSTFSRWDFCTGMSSAVLGVRTSQSPGRRFKSCRAHRGQGEIVCTGVRDLPASGRDPGPTITALPIGSRNRLARRPYTASQNALNRDGGASGGSSDIYALQTRRA